MGHPPSTSSSAAALLWPHSGSETTAVAAQRAEERHTRRSSGGGRPWADAFMPSSTAPAETPLWLRRRAEEPTGAAFQREQQRA